MLRHPIMSYICNKYDVFCSMSSVFYVLFRAGYFSLFLSDASVHMLPLQLVGTVTKVPLVYLCSEFVGVPFEGDSDETFPDVFL